MNSSSITVFENEKFIDFIKSDNSYCICISTTARKFGFQMYGEVQCCGHLGYGVDVKEDIDEEDTNENQIKTLTIDESPHRRINFVVRLTNRTYTFWVERLHKTCNYQHTVILADDQEDIIFIKTL